jgi:hypothetical protein
MIPRSLFGRLVLVLLAGLAAAALATAWINRSERDELLYRAGGMQLAQRIADISRLLDSLPAAERRRVAAISSAPPLAVSLERPPLEPPANAENDFQLTMFTRVLGFALGEGLQPRVVRAPAARVPAPAAPMMRGGMGPGMHGMQPGGASFVVQVALRDGTRVNFDSYLS